eukprot:scaffold10680_cov130-Skeletonema_marinoi.AAC.5
MTDPVQWRDYEKSTSTDADYEKSTSTDADLSTGLRCISFPTLSPPRGNRKATLIASRDIHIYSIIPQDNE